MSKGNNNNLKKKKKKIYRFAVNLSKPQTFIVYNSNLKFKDYENKRIIIKG